MDFPKDYHWKRRINAPQLNLFPKTTIAHLAQTPTLPPSKGRVRIQQYEYAEENLLGMGYTSKVYLGHLIDDNRKQFAIKVVDKRKISKQKQNLQLLKQEMVIHQQLDHPNIVKCHQIIEKTYHYYFVLEYCSQGTLDSFIKKHEKLTESTAVTIMEQIISAYKYLLQQKVLHRDLKPPNILKSGNNWKICDFGFSVIGKKSLIGDINVGTPAYMAPQSLERTYYSPKTDFFSIGIICYEMLFGSAPWQHKNEKVLLSMMQQQKLNHDNFSSISNKNLADFILKCCEPLERKRITVQEFEEFSFWKDYQTSRATSIKLIQPEAECPSRPSSKTICTIREYSLPASSCPSQTTTFSTVRGVKKQSLEQLFNGNNAVIERELYICQILISLMKNYSLLNLSDDCEKDLYLTVLSKHVSYIIRRIKHQKLNYLCLKRWEEYIQSQPYQLLAAQATELMLKMQAIIKTESRRKSIVTIRVINKKYDELTYDKHLSMKCVLNLKEYIHEVMCIFLKQHEEKSDRQLNEASTVTQTLAYQSKYYHYIKNLSIGSEQSRAIAINHDYKQRKSIIEDFKESKLSSLVYHQLKEEIESNT